MANENIGQINCAWCGSRADIRRASTGRKKLYVMCPSCGQQWLNTSAGQEVILTKGVIFGAESVDDQAVVVEKVPSEGVVKPGQDLPKKPRSIFSFDL